MIQDKDTRVIPRSIRCTRAEHIYLSALLKQLRMNSFDFNSQNQPEQPQKFKGAIIMDDLPKERVGISPNEFLAKIGKGRIIEDSTPSMIIKSRLHQESDLDTSKETNETTNKDYTAWHSDPLMQDIYNSCMWDAGGENQCYPEGVEKYQIKYKDLWGRLNEAKRNNKTQACNEIMTEMMERIYNER